MKPADYDAWYRKPRGRWIGDREFALLARLLDARPGETLLDVGCGTGYFSRRLAAEAGLKVTGVDNDPAMLAFARENAPEVEFIPGNAERLSFGDASFDHVVAVTSLCFVADQVQAVREMVRVARHRVVLGLLNRHSMLWLSKRGAGSYADARWHTGREARFLLANAGLRNIRDGYAVFLPEGRGIAHMLESVLPAACPFGGFLAVAGSLMGTHPEKS